MRRAWLALGLSMACATPRALESEAAACESFAAFEGRAQARQEALLAAAPGEVLGRETAALNRARRACARQALNSLARRREASGPEAVQAELDALVVAFRPEVLAVLLDEALGVDAAALGPQVAEARARADRAGGSARAARGEAAALRAQEAAVTAGEPRPVGGPGEAGRSAVDGDLHAAATQVPAAGGGAMWPADVDALPPTAAASRESDQVALRALDAEGRRLEAASREPGAVTWGSPDVPTLARTTSEDESPALERSKADAVALGALGAGEPGRCAAPDACARLRCVAASGAEARAAATEGRACLDALRAEAPWDRARGTAEVLTLVRPARAAAGVATEAQRELETLALALWPQVEAAERPARAARLATPFLQLPSRRAAVEALRDAGVADALARARQASGARQWVFRRLAEELGGPTAPPRPVLAGRWAGARWQCPGAAPALPPVPEGLEARLVVRCPRGPAAPTTDARAGTLRTFEGEAALLGQALEVELTVACTDGRHASARTVQEPGVEGLPEEGLQRALEELLADASGDCRRHAEAAQARSCTALSRLDADEAVARVLPYAAALGGWPPCFQAWWLEREGAALPAWR